MSVSSCLCHSSLTGIGSSQIVLLLSAGQYFVLSLQAWLMKATWRLTRLQVQVKALSILFRTLLKLTFSLRAFRTQAPRVIAFPLISHHLSLRCGSLGPKQSSSPSPMRRGVLVTHLKPKRVLSQRHQRLTLRLKL